MHPLRVLLLLQLWVLLHAGGEEGDAGLRRFVAAHLANDFGAGKATAKQKRASRRRALLKKSKVPCAITRAFSVF
jgi:hypothetical protein